MGKRKVLVWDDNVEECFNTQTAIYYEALRYWQKLQKEEWFEYHPVVITKVTGLTYKEQLRCRKLLVGAGWIEMKRIGSEQGGSRVFFYITDLARHATKDTLRRYTRRDILQLFKAKKQENSVKGIFDNYTPFACG